MSTQSKYWTNPSVLALAKGEDPTRVIVDRSRAMVLDAIQAGWSGPPFDPVDLAKRLNISVVPHENIQDARTIPIGANRLRIEFNPNRPPARTRYSVAHELAHTLFPDIGSKIQNRVAHEEMKGDDWQLEMLCNIGAAEMLMPIGSFPELKTEAISIDRLLELRREYGVSIEALLLRFVKITGTRCLVFCASKQDSSHQTKYRIDYALPSKVWKPQIPPGSPIPSGSVVEQCTAIGFTAKGWETWPPFSEKFRVECVGASPYPTSPYPRVVGLLLSKEKPSNLHGIEYLVGDATKPRGDGHRIIAHVVNDKAMTWGAGFARVVRAKWPAVQDDFKNWATANPNRFSLGHLHLSTVDGQTSVAHMISQHGYGPSPKPRIRYNSLRSCLTHLAEIANTRNATVHMPRIGCGEAGGEWPVVEELVSETLLAARLSVIVYDLRDRAKPREEQGVLHMA